MPPPRAKNHFGRIPGPSSLPRKMASGSPREPLTRASKFTQNSSVKSREPNAHHPMTPGGGGTQIGSVRTWRRKVFSAISCVLSVTRTEKEKVPASLGVPSSTPLAPKCSPGGRVPPTKDHIYGGFPSAASNWYEAKEPTVAGDNEAVVMVNAVHFP